MFYALSLKKIKRFIVMAIFIALVIFIGTKAVNRLFPMRYAEYINKYSQMYNLNPALVYAVISSESSFRKEALSPKGAKGLMQLMETTAEWGASQIGIEYDKSKIYNPEINIQIGCWYLNNLLKQFDDNLLLALAAYNAGSGNVSKWLLNEEYSNDGKNLIYIPFKETRDYIEKVTYKMEIYDIMLNILSRWRSTNDNKKNINYNTSRYYDKWLLLFQ